MSSDVPLRQSTARPRPQSPLANVSRAVAAQALAVLRDQGAILVDPANLPSVIDPRPAHNVLSFPQCDVRRPACSLAWLYGMKP